ncbi:MAG: hypothetical protein II567_01430 [Candidatus Riflebacteria bacterium]|nr:hypothetical protein [Candidatus Riflebacteria bacterium]
MKKILFFCLFVALTVLGAYIGFQLAQLRRPVDSSRMEKCLALYKSYRADTDQDKLAKELSKISLTPNDFQHIIDKFILYRTQKSSMNQAMKLLKAFRMGFDIEVEKVYSISGMENEPFRLDAEILTVFEKKPELVKDAFEG